MSTRSNLKSMYYSSPELMYLYAELKCLTEYFQLRQTVRRLGIDENQIDSVNRIRQTFAGSTHKTCHIIGSGKSVLDSIKSIDNDNDFVIGFNHAGLLPIEFDVYFTEVATHSGNEAGSSDIHEELYFKLCKRREPKMYLKCLWETEWWSTEFVHSRYESNLRVILDVMPNLPLLANSKLLNLANQSIFRRRRNHFFVNGASSAVFSVLFAYQIGFRNIVVHGVDFMGPHFFYSTDFKDSSNLIHRIREYCPAVPSDFVHGAGKWMSLQWPHVIRALSKTGVTVYSGTQASLFSSYAPVYVPYTVK